MVIFRIATYIEEIANHIWQETTDYPSEGFFPSEDDRPLYLGYAVLALAKGEHTTSEDVHDAWSAWAAIKYHGRHRSLIPFDQLTPEVQAYDDVYRDAIHEVARARKGTA